MAKAVTTPETIPAERSPMLTGIETLIGLVEKRARELEGQSVPLSKSAPEPTRDVPDAGTLATQMEDLDIFLRRLRQIHDWLKQDPRLLPVVDDAIGRRVRALEQRQTRQNVTLAAITTVTGAVLGWLISLLGTPVTAWHALLH
jgi:hypothetical protein